MRVRELGKNCNSMYGYDYDLVPLEEYKANVESRYNNMRTVRTGYFAVLSAAVVLFAGYRLRRRVR